MRKIDFIDLPVRIKAVNDLKKAIAELESITKSARTHNMTRTKVKQGVKTDGMHQIDTLLELQEQYDNQFIELVPLQLAAEKIISNLTGVDRRIMKLRHLKCCTWEEIAYELSRTAASVRAKHRRIIERLVESGELTI